MSQFLKIVGMFALSAAAAAGTSLWASNANAQEEENAVTADDGAAEADEENTAESAEEIIRPWGYRGYGRWWGPGYGYYGHRRFYPGYRRYFPGYRSYYPPYFRPGIRCGFHPYYGYTCW